jgi:hypothetical protein
MVLLPEPPLEPPELAVLPLPPPPVRLVAARNADDAFPPPPPDEELTVLVRLAFDCTLVLAMPPLKFGP